RRSTSVTAGSRSSPRLLRYIVCEARVSDPPAAAAAARVTEYVEMYGLPPFISVAGSLVSNGGYPYISTYSVTRAAAAAAGVSLTRASQTIYLSSRGDERLPAVTLVDL